MNNVDYLVPRMALLTGLPEYQSRHGDRTRTEWGKMVFRCNAESCNARTHSQVSVCCVQSTGHHLVAIASVFCGSGSM